MDQAAYKGQPIRITANFSAETKKDIKSWEAIIQVLKDHNFQPRLGYSAKLLDMIKEEEKFP